MPQAGSQMTSLAVGAVSSTMSWMMWRGVRNWPFCPAVAIFAEHVFVEVALGVAIFHRHLVDHVHDLGQQRRRGDGESRVLHVMRVGGIIAAQRAQERENVVVHDLEHFRRRSKFLKRDQRQIFVGPALRVFSLGKNAALHRLFQPGALCFPPACADHRAA